MPWSNIRSCRLLDRDQDAGLGPDCWTGTRMLDHDQASGPGPCWPTRACRGSVQIPASAWLPVGAAGGDEGGGCQRRSCWSLLRANAAGFSCSRWADPDSVSSSFSRIDKVKVLSLMLHAADISHPAKAWPLHYHWTHSLMEEFFRQVHI